MTDSYERVKANLQPVLAGIQMPKCDGTAEYVSDLASSDMLYGVIIRAPYPTCRIRKIDSGRALSVPGVVAVVTARDIEGENWFGRGEEKDMQYLAEERTFSLYDAVALIAAESREAAQRGAALLAIDAVEEKGIYSYEHAMEEGASEIHPGQSNIMKEYHYCRGDWNETAKRADLIVTADFALPPIEHCYLETDCAFAFLSGDMLHVYVGCHSVISEKTNISKALNIPEEKIQVHLPYMGGSFGGKDDALFAVYAAVLAKKTNRPVRLQVSRKDELVAHTKRHPQNQHASLALDKDGKFLGLKTELITDTGSAAHVASSIFKFVSVNAAGPYKIDVTDVSTKIIYTNNVANGAMRSWGMTGATFVLETLINMAASRLGMDPLTIREKNALHDGDMLMCGAVVPDGVRYEECIEKMHRSLSTLKLRHPGQQGRYAYGVGYAGCSQGSNFHFGHRDHSICRLKVDHGNVEIQIAACDLGEGLEAALIIIVSQALGNYPAERIRYKRPASDDPDGGSTGASRQTTMSGNAALDAAENLVERVKESIMECYGIQKQEIVFEDGFLCFHDKKIRLLDYFETLSTPIEVTGEFTGEETSMPDDDGYGRPINQFSYGIHRAEVEVDTVTGLVRLISYYAVHDAGRILNPAGAEGQIEGGISQGIGMALMESLVYKDGMPQQTGFTDYLIPTFMDLPTIKVDFINKPVQFGKLGVKGLGEAGLTPPAPAIIAAIYDAVGVWITELPASPDKIFQALEGHHV